MKKQSYLEINKEQLKAFMQVTVDEPVMMLNLLKFKDEVAEIGLSGEKCYQEYMSQAIPFFEKANAEILFYGHPKHILIGPEDEILWDKVLVVKYASVTDFIGMVKADGYPSHLRVQALQDSRLIHCSE